MFRNLVRHLKEGFYGVGRHAAMSLSSASAVTITLILISIFLMLTANLQILSKGVEGTVSIYAKIGYEYETQENFDRIENSIKNIEGVKTVSFSNKETEFNYLLETYDDEETKAAIEMYRGDNPLHNAFLIETQSGELIQSVAQQLKEIEGIDPDGVNYGGDSAIMLVKSLQSINKGGFILVAALSLLAIFLIANTIKLTIYARNKEISIMRNVGATNGFIRAPFVVEGLIIGALGSIIPIIISIFGYIYLYNLLGGVLFSNIFPLVEPHPFTLYLSGVLLATGMLVGLVGSFFSVTKYLRWKR